MGKYLNLLLAVALPLLASCSTMSKPAPKTATAPETKGARPAIKTLTAQKFSRTVEAEYLLYLPEGYHRGAKKKWPLILFLHGSGERGTNIWRATIHGPINYVKAHPDFPFILVTPHLAAGQKWSDDSVLAILDEVIAKQDVDTNRIYLTGLSTGGYGSWSLATTYPERFAAVAPVCGGEGNIGVILSLMDPVKKPALQKLPIWAFHGMKDHVVLEQESQRMVDILKKAGNTEVKLTTYPDLDHNSWTVTYNNPELYEWFLQHQLTPTPKK